MTFRGCLAAAIVALGLLATGCKRGIEPAAEGAPEAGRVDTNAHANATYPLRVRDDRGVWVTVSAEPRRIVSLMPSHTETLFALGTGDRVVGVDDFSDWPPAAAGLPKLGGIYDVHLERCLSLKPDLVLLLASSNAARSLEADGLAVWGGEARTFDDIFRVLEAIGALVGRNAEAARLSHRMREDIAGIELRVRDAVPVRVYYELDATPFTVGPTSFIGTLLTKAGGQNIVPADLGDFPRISPEAVIAGNPSVIFGASLDEVRARPGWEGIEAVRAGRVYKLPESESQLVARPGPRIVEGLRVLVRHLHPEVAL